MTMLLIELAKALRHMEFDGSHKWMQRVVGGYVQAFYPFDDPAVLICSEEGKILGFTLNRRLIDDEGNHCDIVAGTFFLGGVPPDSENSTSLGKELMERCC